MTAHVLSWLLWLPLLGLLVLACLPARFARAVALSMSLVVAGLAVWMAMQFPSGSAGYQFVERVPWMPSIGVQYLLGVDGISLLFVVLSAVLTPVAIAASTGIQTREKPYYGMLLVLLSGMIGVFAALDFILFYVCWELVLIPMYFIVGVWGSGRRVYAAFKFFLYTLLGSVFLLLGGVVLYFQSGGTTFEFGPLLASATAGNARFVWWAFFLAFAVKVPVFPFHTWLPDAHSEAPTAGSVLLAGVLLKMGVYGFIRLSLPLLPALGPGQQVTTVLGWLAIVGILYGALLALQQHDWKRLVAYSSVSHLGFILLGISAGTPNGLAGAVLQSVNHGISTGLLFLLVGFLYEQRHTREIRQYGGVAHVLPGYAKVFAFAVFSSAGLPLLNGFIGEFTILQGAFTVRPEWAACAVVGIVLSAGYLLWLYQRTMLGPLANPLNASLRDLTKTQRAIVLPLIAWAVWIGVYPKPYFDLLRAPVQQLSEQITTVRQAQR